MGLLDEMKGMAALTKSNGNGALNPMAQGMQFGFAITEQLSHIAQLIEQGLKADEYMRVRAQGVASAAGRVDLELTPPPGVAWELVTIAYSVSTGGGAGSIALYLDEVQPTNLIYADTTQTLNSSNFGNGEYVPQFGKVIVRFDTQTANAICTVTMRARKLNIDAVYELENAPGFE